MEKRCPSRARSKQGHRDGGKTRKEKQNTPPHFSRLLAHLITIPENWNREGGMGKRTWESLGDPTTGTLKGSFPESEKKAM